MTETLEHSLVTTRMQWLDFCEANSVPVPESNAVIMIVSSAVYELMLERAGDIKNSLSDEAIAVPAAVTDAVEADDVYLQFGGAALCDMLHLHYKQIKSCIGSQRAKLSEEIMILQAINIKDKSKIPQYLRYCDKYFPDISFIPFLQSIDEVVKGIMNKSRFEQDGSE